MKSSGKKKILFAIESFYDGGAEMFAIRLANEMCKHYEVFFMEVFPYKSQVKNQRKLLKSGEIRIIQAGKNILGYWLHNTRNKSNIRRRLNRFYTGKREKKIASFIQKNNIEIVHSHTWKTDVFFSELKTFSDFKLISSLHGHYEFLKSAINNFESTTENAVRHIDKFVYLTKSHLQTLDRFNVPAEKRVKIFYGLNDQFKSSVTLSDNKKLLKLAFAARGIPEKGWEEIIRACLNLFGRYPNKLQLYLIGDSEYVKELSRIYQSENIFFCGYLQNIMPFIASCDIGLLPSYFSGESLPNVIIEYLSCGKPVIATKIGAIEEMLTYENEIAGTLIDMENGKVKTEDIEAAIEKYINDPSLVKHHASSAIKAAEKFDMQNCMREYSKLYSELLLFDF